MFMTEKDLDPANIYNEMSTIDKAKLIFKSVGAIISFLNLISEILYSMMSLFTSSALYASYKAFILIRLLLILALGCNYFCKKVCIY